MYKKILIVDDEVSIREFFQILLKKMSQESQYSFEMSFAQDGQKALELIKKQSFDMIISDLKMPNLSGLDLLKQAKVLQPSAVFIIITAFDTSETAVQAMKVGAYDYIPKPFNLDEIKITILSGLRLKKLEVENQQLKKELSQERNIDSVIGQSPAMQKVFKEIKQISHSNSTVLITGESGTGKEVIARQIHKASVRKDQAFIPVNCGAVPDTLIESEMFGHKKGSFTGAVQDKKGLFELADGGTLFLDEIGELALMVQPKLLRALQEKTIKRVGDISDRKVDIRLIVATNRDLEKMVQMNSFREDLFYRLNVLRMHLPPLRERREDIPLLVEHFLEKYCQKLLCGLKKISDGAMSLFQEYPYPGNVRELENLMERVVILCQEEEIQREDLLPLIGDGELKSSLKSSVPEISLPEKGLDIEKILGEIEKNLIVQALNKTGGMKGKAADLLHLSPRTFRYRLQKHHLDDDEQESRETKEVSGGEFIK